MCCRASKRSPPLSEPGGQSACSRCGMITVMTPPDHGTLGAAGAASRVASALRASTLAKRTRRASRFAASSSLTRRAVPTRTPSRRNPPHTRHPSPLREREGTERAFSDSYRGAPQWTPPPCSSRVGAPSTQALALSFPLRGTIPGEVDVHPRGLLSPTSYSTTGSSAEVCPNPPRATVCHRAIAVPTRAQLDGHPGVHAR